MFNYYFTTTLRSFYCTFYTFSAPLTLNWYVESFFFLNFKRVGCFDVQQTTLKYRPHLHTDARWWLERKMKGLSPLIELFVNCAYCPIFCFIHSISDQAETLFLTVLTRRFILSAYKLKELNWIWFIATNSFCEI